MRQSASTHSLIPVSNRQKRTDILPSQTTLVAPPVPPKVNSSIMTSGLGISVSPSRVPVRAPQDRLKSLFSGATMVGGRMENYSDIANGVGSIGSEARAPNMLSEPFRTPN